MSQPNSLKTNDGRLIIVGGSSRCGKTTKTVELSAEFQTVFVWDIEQQWCELKGFKQVKSLNELKKIAIDGRVGRWAYVSNKNIKAEFEFFCQCAYHYGRYFGECAVIAEELADVTTTAKAPDSWGILCRRGLKRSITIFAISQRWAEADKTALGNATDFYLFRMSSGDDINYMAKKTRVTVEVLEALESFEYAHYEVRTKKTDVKKLIFKK